MFNRRLSQKPTDDFVSVFKRQYSGLLPVQEESISHPVISTSSSACQTPKLAFDPRHFGGNSGRDNGQFTLGSLELPSEFETAGMLDPNVDGFHDFSQPGGLWPPTPQGSVQYGGGPDPFAGQHNPFGMDTPVSASTQFHGYPPTGNPFSEHEFIPSQRVSTFPGTHHQFEPQGVAPHSFRHSMTHPGHLEAQSHGLHMSDVSLSQGFDHAQPPSATRTIRQPASESIGPRSVIDAMSQFRFRTIMKAQTAMIKHPQDIPVTYLNKSQVYTIHVEDSSLSHTLADPSLKYRTAIRISFEDEQQRKVPATSWQLWNEGRGTNEAIKRGVKPKAVEYVNQDQSQTDSRSNLQPVVENFDGFSVVWSPNTDGIASCNIQLRFNFLSTDFSHSKGVKGVPVRLCAKTELVEGQHLVAGNAVNREICYCAVKIFRDHGAERKLANDKAHIDKLIDKFTTQAEQADVGVKEGGKRRRSDSLVNPRPTKVTKHKRTWSASSSDSEAIEGGEDELAIRIRSLKAMPESVRSASAFYLRGEEQDDLDTHPVPPLSETPPSSSPARPKPPILRTETTQSSGRSPAGFDSGTPVSRSPSIMRLKAEVPSQAPPSLSNTPSRQGKSPVKQEVRRSTPQQLASPPSSGPLKAKTSDQLPSATPIPTLGEALDVDSAYQPPPERKLRAVAEFFVKPSLSWKLPVDDNYRAIYLYELSLKDLVRAIAVKCDVDPAAIVTTVRVNAQGLVISLDDESVEQMRERQSFIAELDVAESTHDSAAQFFESHDDGLDTGIRYKLALRY